VVLAFIVAAAIADTQTTAQTLYKKTQAAVVTIDTPTMAGTGFIVGDGSLVLTCYHVIKESPGAITVKGFGHATLLRSDPQCDIAILTLRKKSPVHLKISRGASPSPGAQVFVIGSPLGILDKSITEGTLSSIRRIGDRALLQITAPISHGSSGSPVLDRKGEVIGMAAATLEQGQGLNFAISAMNLRKVLQAKGKSSPPKKAHLETNSTIITLRAVSVFGSPDPYSEEVYSCRKGEVIDVAVGKRPGWVLIGFKDATVGYLEEKYVRKATTEEIEALEPLPEYPAGSKELVEKYIAAFLKSSTTQKKEIRERLLAMGDKVLRALVIDLRDPQANGEISYAKAELLGSFQRRAEADILAMIADGNRYEREAACYALRSNSVSLTAQSRYMWLVGEKIDVGETSRFLHSEKIVDALISEIDDPHAQSYAATTLGYTGIERAHDPIQKLLDGRVGPDASLVAAFVNIARPDDRRLIGTLIDRVTKNYLTEPKDVDLIPSSDEVSDCFIALVSSRRPVCIEVATKFLNHSSPDIRLMACEGFLKARVPEYLPLVQTLLGDEDPGVRRYALLTATTLGDTQQKERIIALCRSDDSSDRMVSTATAAQGLRGKERHEMMDLLLHDKSPEVRKELLLAALFLPEEESAWVFGQLQKDPDPSVRKVTLEMIEALKDGRVIRDVRG